MLFSPALSEVSDKLLRYVERTFARTFEFVQALGSVTDIYDLTKLQQEFIEAQISAVIELVREFGGNATKPAMHNLNAPTSNAAQVTLTLKNLAAALAERQGMARKRMEELLNGAIALIGKHLEKGDRIRIAGLGTLQVRNRAARMGRNPATGKRIEIKANKTVAFRASKELNEAVSGSQIGDD
jgi:DNA-binding protein HU-beta